jgi:hypothetical protein
MCVSVANSTYARIEGREVFTERCMTRRLHFGLEVGDAFLDDPFFVLASACLPVRKESPPLSKVVDRTTEWLGAELAP